MCIHTCRQSRVHVGKKSSWCTLSLVRKPFRVFVWLRPSQQQQFLGVFPLQPSYMHNIIHIHPLLHTFDFMERVCRLLRIRKPINRQSDSWWYYACWKKRVLVNFFFFFLILNPYLPILY